MSMSRKPPIPAVKDLEDAPIGAVILAPRFGAEPLEKVEGGLAWRGVRSGARATTYGAYWRGYRAKSRAKVAA